jgi:hypothetical protein
MPATPATVRIRIAERLAKREGTGPSPPASFGRREQNASRAGLARTRARLDGEGQLQRPRVAAKWCEVVRDLGVWKIPLGHQVDDDLFDLADGFVLVLPAQTMASASESSVMFW